MEKTNNLLDKALTNFDAAKTIRRSIENEDDEMINIVAYHLHQSVELSLKFTLEMNGVEYPNVHRIEDLLRIGKMNNVDLHVNDYIIDHDALLSSWEANTRYVIGYLAELGKIDKAIEELEKYFNVLLRVFNS